MNLFPTFGGPWAETPCRPQDIDFHVPHEYLTNTAIRWVATMLARKYITLGILKQIPAIAPLECP